eukprot:4498393-Lingulodinium_polyedra.AAC.1
MWNPRALIRAAQKKYAEFWGSRVLRSRELEPVPGAARAQQLRESRKRFCPGRRPEAPSPAATAQARQPRRLRQAQWDAAARTL